jgi:pentatricopeptide repeat protein
MPSHLTRLVFRSIVANEPLLYRGCRLRTARPRLVARTARVLPQTQRRTFFELFKQRRKMKPVEIPAGWETISEVDWNLQTKVRPPEPKVVAAALKEFFAQRKGAFADLHIAKAHTAFKYLLDNPREDGTPWLSAIELYNGIYVPLLHKNHRPETGGSEHLKFGKSIVEEYARQLEGGPAEQATPREQKLSLTEDVNTKMVRLLSTFGAATDARDLAATAFKPDPDSTPEQRQVSRKAWGTVVGGIVQEANMEELRQTMALIQDLSVPVTTRMQTYLVTLFAKRKEMEDAKLWYACPVVNQKDGEDASPHSNTSAALLTACALCGDITFGQQVVGSLLKSDLPDKGAWDAVFLWSAAIGKGVDEVDRMMGVMARRNDEARHKDPSVQLIRPDVDTINTLVEFCMSKQDPYSAERYIALGEKRGISPDERTYTMQIQYRLSVKDYDGARAAYFNLQGDFSGAEQSVAVINQLIQAMCEHQQHHFDELMVMVDDLHERKSLFAPQTIAALCVLHLRRGERHDAVDLLQVHAHQFSPDQRRLIQKSLLAFILDGETSTADAWETYQILRNVFQETSRQDRIKILNEFFARKRSDMACHVFFHMRNHISPDHCANREVYIAAFTGFAHRADAESLELAHNQMKLDLNVDPDTRLRNALMLAYGATGEHDKALQFWREICESKEGPSYNSIAIAFRACEEMHFGHGHARSIWKRLIEQDVEIDKTIWKAYMCAIARNHQYDEAQGLIESVEEDYGFTLDLDM